MKWNIHHLEGRYAYDTEAGMIWGYFEKEHIPVIDGRVHIKFIPGSDAESTFNRYGTRSKADVPIDVLRAYDGEGWVMIAPLLTKGQMSSVRGQK